MRNKITKEAPIFRYQRRARFRSFASQFSTETDLVRSGAIIGDGNPSENPRS